MSSSDLSKPTRLSGSHTFWRRGYVFHSLSACAGCGAQGDEFGSVNVEAFEVTGELYCEECAEEAIVRASSEDPTDMIP